MLDGIKCHYKSGKWEMECLRGQSQKENLN